jgi:hypothetical protein
LRRAGLSRRVGANVTRGKRHIAFTKKRAEG